MHNDINQSARADSNGISAQTVMDAGPQRTLADAMKGNQNANKERENSFYNVKAVSTQGGNSAPYLAARLKRDGVKSGGSGAAESKLQGQSNQVDQSNFDQRWLIDLADKSGLTKQTAYNWWSAFCKETGLTLTPKQANDENR